MLADVATSAVDAAAAAVAKLQEFVAGGVI